MNIAKKLLSLFSVIVMLCTLCACGKVTHEKLNGEWTLTATPTAMEMDQIFPFDGFEYTEKLVLKAVFSDGVLDLYTDGMATWVEGMADALYRWIAEEDNVYVFFASINEMSVDAYKVECAAAGIGKEKLLEQFTTEVTKELLTQELLNSFGNADTLTHSYEIEDGKLCFDEGAVWTVTVSKKKIVVTEIKNEDGTLEIENDGMIFTR